MYMNIREEVIECFSARGGQSEQVRCFKFMASLAQRAAKDQQWGSSPALNPQAGKFNACLSRALMCMIFMILTELSVFSLNWIQPARRNLLCLVRRLWGTGALLGLGAGLSLSHLCLGETEPFPLLMGPNWMGLELPVTCSYRRRMDQGVKSRWWLILHCSTWNLGVALDLPALINPYAQLSQLSQKIKKFLQKVLERAKIELGSPDEAEVDIISAQW